MKPKQQLVIILALSASQLLALESAQGETTTQTVQTNWFPAAAPASANFFSSQLPMFGPADILASAWVGDLNLPTGAVLTNDSLTFTLQAPVNLVSFDLNIFQLTPGGDWGPTTTRNDLANQIRVPSGTVRVTSLYNAAKDEYEIVFQDGALITLGNTGRLADPFYWNAEDAAALFPQGAVAFSGRSPSNPPSNTATFTVIPEPATYVWAAVGIAALGFLRRRRG